MKKIYLKIKIALVLVLTQSFFVNCFKTKRACNIVSTLTGISAAGAFKLYQEETNYSTIGRQSALSSFEPLMFGLGVALWTNEIYKSYLKTYQIRYILKKAKLEFDKINKKDKDLIVAIKSNNILDSFGIFYNNLKIQSKSSIDNYNLILISSYLLNLKKQLSSLLCSLNLQAQNFYEPSNKDLFNQWNLQKKQVKDLLDHTNKALEFLYLSEEYQAQRKEYYRVIEVAKWQQDIKDLTEKIKELKKDLINFI